MGGGRLARHAAVVRAGGRRDRRVRRVHDHLLSRAARHEAVKPYLALLLLGLGLGVLVVVVVRLGGGRDGAIGGAVAVAAQLAAVALLRPALRAPQRVFMARWLGGMGVRALALGALLVYAVTERAALAPLPASLGFLGVLLPLLFVETEFLK